MLENVKDVVLAAIGFAIAHYICKAIDVVS